MKEEAQKVFKASRILKPPDTYNGEDMMAFQQWSSQFTSWLSFGEPKYAAILDQIEGRATPPEFSTYTSAEQDLARRLFAVLTSYLRGKRSHMVRSEMKSKDGFRLWYNLIQEFRPSTRQRSLALAQALSTYPKFPQEKSALECILQYEQVVQQFEESIGSTYPDELKAATIIRCCAPRLREQLQLSISDSSSYREIREKVTSYERVTRSWNQEQVLKHITDQQRRGDDGGPTPMEVDRVEKGGKNKGKGKKGGKGGSWWSGASAGGWKGRGDEEKERARRDVVRVIKRVSQKARKVERINTGRRARVLLDPINASCATVMVIGVVSVLSEWM